MKAQFELYEPIIKNMKSFERHSNGFYKECILSNDKNYKNFALLKYYRKVNNEYNARYAFYDKCISATNKLIEEGVNTPKIYYMLFADKNYFELQQKALGDTLFVYNPKNAIKKFINPNYTDFGMDNMFNMSYEDKNKLFYEVAKYNLNSVNTLANAPQKHFDKFLKDLLICAIKYKVDFDDNNPENFLYSKTKGFNLIDLSLGQTVLNFFETEKERENYYNKMKIKVDFEKEYNNLYVVSRFLDIFLNAPVPMVYTKNSGFEVDTKSNLIVNEIKEKNKSVLSKAVKAIKNCELQFSCNEFLNIFKNFDLSENPDWYNQIVEDFEKYDLLKIEPRKTNNIDNNSYLM